MQTGVSSICRWIYNPELDHLLFAYHIPRMAWFTSAFEGLQFWTSMSLFSAMVVAISSFADWRRSRRRDINAVGFMPWTAITLLGVLASVISAALALKGF